MLHRQKRRYRWKQIITGTMMVLLLPVLVGAGVLLWTDAAGVTETAADMRMVSEENTFGGMEPMEQMDVLPQTSAAVPQKGYVFVLDAGHGFGDPGCESDFMDETEAEVTLDIAMRLGEKLRALGAEVYLTHDGDNYPSPEKLSRLLAQTDVSCMPERLIDDGEYSPYERTVYASYINAQNPVTLFLSIHVNSLPGSPEVSQRELYYWEGNPQREKLEQLTSALTDAYSGITKTEASDYDEAFIVTKYVTFPALLMEIGYSTNPEDAARINDLFWREEFCEALAQTLLTWAEAG